MKKLSEIFCELKNYRKIEPKTAILRGKEAEKSNYHEILRTFFIYGSQNLSKNRDFTSKFFMGSII